MTREEENAYANSPEARLAQLVDQRNQRAHAAAIKDMPSGKEFWEQAALALGYVHDPEYFVSREPIQGEPITYGPFSLAQEAREVFEETYPSFDGGSVWLTKVESNIPGVSPSQLRDNAFREEYEHGDPEEQKWGEIYSRSSTVVARDAWGSTNVHGEIYWHHKGKQYEPSFLAEIADRANSKSLQDISQERSAHQHEIETIHESEWHQAFGSECKEHLGKDKDGYYYALEIGESDLSWQGPFTTRDEAEERLSEAFNRWDERIGEREQAWEDQQIAQFEKENTNTKGFAAAEGKEPLIKPIGFIGKDILAVERNEMTDTQLRSQNVAQQERIEQLEIWIEAAITRPSMSRELRLQGLELVEAQRPDVRLAVERICPSQSLEIGRELEIER